MSGLGLGPKPRPQVAPLTPPSLASGAERGQAIPTTTADVTNVRPTAAPDLDLSKLWEQAQQVYNHPKGGHRLADAFVREQTGGGIGYDELAQNATVNPGTVGGSLFQGATLNFGDRIRALSRTLGQEEGGLVNTPMGPMPEPNPPPIMPGAYGRNLNAVRRALAIFNATHPVLDPALQVTGGLATGLAGGEVTGLKEGTSLFSSTMKGAGVGGGVAGVSALGAQPDLAHPDWRSILAQTAVGAAGGGIVGGGAFEAGRFSPAWLARTRLRHALSAEASPEAEAMDALYQRTGRSGIRTMADLSPALQSEGDFAATASPEVKMHLRNQFLTRSAGQADRLQDDLTRYYGQTPSALERGANLHALARRIENDPQNGYEAVASRAGNVTDPRLNPLLNRPGVRGPVNTAIGELQTGGTPNPQPTDARSLFYVYRRLRGAASTAFASGDRDLGASLAGAHGELRSILEDNVPEFGQLNRRLAPVLGAQQALQDVPNFFTNVDRQTLASRLSAMHPLEAESYREGTANALREALDASRTDRNVARGLAAAGPSLKSKLELIFGKQTPNFLDATNAENELAQRNSMFSGSQTAGREQEIHTVPKLRVTEGGEGGLLGGFKARLFENLPLFNTRGMARRAGEIEAPVLFRPGLPLAEARSMLARRALMDRFQAGIPAAAGAAAAQAGRQ